MDDSTFQKRSLTLKGHKTSVALEKAFWTVLEEMAQKRHGIEKGEDATETLTNVIDNALALIWANKT